MSRSGYAVRARGTHMRRVLGVVMVTGVAFTLWAAVSASAGAASAPTVGASSAAVERAMPRKVWIGGDSMAAQICATLTSKLRASGVKLVPALCKTSSGIVRTDFLNWPNAARAQMTKYKPQAAVFMIGTNDHQNITAKGTVYQFGTSGWKSIYRTRVAAIMKAMLSNGAKHVYWIGMPIMADASFGNAMKVLNAIYKSEAGKRSGQVTYIDAWKLFSNSSGQYVSGWRASDGIHFNMSGVKRLAGVVVAKVKKDF